MIKRLSVCACALFVFYGLVPKAEGSLISPGFELGPPVAEISFTPTDFSNLGWFASHTDGERFQSTSTKMAAEGNYYASLLQNGGAYNGAQLGIGDFGFTGFDRIYATFDVLANTTYVVSFQHAGDNRSMYLADTSVVEIVDAQANTTIAQEMFVTPGAFQWQMESFQFTTGANTNSAAIALTVMGASNSSAVFDDIRIEAVSNPVPEPTTLCMWSLIGIAFAGTALRCRYRLKTISDG